MFAKQSYTKMFHSWYGNTEELRRLALPFLIGRLVEQFLNELQDSKYKRINIFTAHDTTSSYFKKIFETYRKFLPELSATFISYFSCAYAISTPA